MSAREMGLISNFAVVACPGSATPAPAKSTIAYGWGRGCGEGRGLGVALGVADGVAVGVTLGVAVGVAVGGAVGVAVDEGVGVGVAVGVGVTVGVGVGVTSENAGARTWTVTGEPVLKKPMVAVAVAGGLFVSKRKLYSVPQRMALAFGF